MRDILVTAIIFGLLPFILMRPQIGIYTWSWIGYMNPHRLTWGFAYTMPFAQLVGLATLLSIALWKEPKRLPINIVTVLWFALLLWMFITTLNAMQPEWAWAKLDRVMKIQLFVLLTIVVIRTKRELDILIWVIVLSIGFFTVKGGIFTIQTLGAHRVWGPTGTFIHSNNELSVASMMILPLMYYLRSQVSNVWIKRALVAMMVLTVVSAMGAYSRSGFVAAGATALFLWWKTPHKFVTGTAIVIVAVGVLTFMPQSWHDRMGTIATYQEDRSAMNRFAAWTVATNLASDRFTGGGFDFWSAEMFRKYQDDPRHWDRGISAHSVYFTMLGEHGWIGLTLFLSVFASAWRMSSRIASACKGIPDLIWIRQLLLLVQVSLVAWATGGAFLSMAYFDLPWHLVSVILISRLILDKYKLGQVDENGITASDPLYSRYALESSAR